MTENEKKIIIEVLKQIEGNKRKLLSLIKGQQENEKD
jgi:DNA replication initiation complex subunit (GINS family)